MTSLQSLWALVGQLGLEPTVLFSKAGEKAALHLGGKAAKAAGKQAKGAAKAILSYWANTVDTSFPAYLNDRLAELDAEERPAIVEAAFCDWVASRTTESAELSRLLFRLVYLRALVGHCADLPVLADVHLDLDDVWVPQIFRRLLPETPRQRQADHVKFTSLEHAVSACGAPLVLLGDSGSGKSTQLRKLVLDISRRQLEMTDFAQFIGEPLPIYVQAQTLVSDMGDLTTTVSRAVSRELERRLRFPLPDQFLDSRQPGAANSIFLVIDGLDEISREQRDNLVSSIRRHGANFDIVLGSRSPLPQHGITHVEIEEPSAEQADALREKLATVLGKSKGGGGDLPRNPLILTLAALLRNQTTGSRATLYQEFLRDRLSRSNDPALADQRAGFILLEACALAGDELADKLEHVAADLLPAQLIGLARTRRARNLLIATGAIRETGEQLTFVHESFRSFLKAEVLARTHRPSPAPWGKVSPFREGWEVLGFMLEIWRRDGEDVAPALEGLLAFGEAGLRLAGQIASRDGGLPARVIETVVAKWMHGDDEEWSPGYADGPVQQLGLLARHYECARAALRKIAGDNWTYWEDSGYAARELARAGQAEEGQRLLMALSRKLDALWDNRALAVDLLEEMGAVAEARICGFELAAEWPVDTSDAYIAWVRLASTLHRLGEKRAATRMLEEVEDAAEVDGHQLRLESLAEAYLEIGKPRKAKAAARRAFDTWEWSAGLTRGRAWEATGLAGVLHRAGALREAELIHRRVGKVEGKATDDLVAIANDRGKETGKRWAASLVLLERQPETGISALEAILNDPGAERYRRFEEVPQLLDSPARQRTIETLRRIAADEPWHRIDCGSLLVKAGQLEEGYSLLSKVALEPGEDLGDRVQALERLAQSGNVDLAMAAFRRLLHSGALDQDHLGRIEAVLAYTAGWDEFLDACEQLLAAENQRLRMKALAILVRALRIARGTKRAINLLERIVRDRELAPVIRRRALHELDDMDGDALDLAINIGFDSDESMEAGLAAMDFLRGRDNFYAADCGHDVVWDKKLTTDQFIHAAYRFIAMIPASNDGSDEDEDAPGYWGRGIAEAMQEELLQIAADPSQPVERRLAAAGVVGGDGGWRDTAYRPALEAICNDETLSLRERLPAIHNLLVQDPAQYKPWQLLLWSDQVDRIEAAYVFLTENIYMRDASAELFHAALGQEDDLHVRVRIWKELAGLVEADFAGKEAANALQQIVRDGELRLDAGLVTDLLSLSRAALREEEYKDLVAEVARSDQLDAHAFAAAARILIDVGSEALAADLLRQRKRALVPISGKGRPFDYLLMLRIEASLGWSQEAIAGLNALCADPKLGIADRALACQILSGLGQTRDANRHLEKLATRAKSFDDRLAVVNCAAAQHNWALARRVLLAFKVTPQSYSERCQFASALAAAGMKSKAVPILKEADPDIHEFLWEGGFDTLLECGERRRAIAMCCSYAQNAELAVDDRIEVLGKLGDVGHSTMARRLCVQLIKGESRDAVDQAAGASTLHRLGFEAEARTILLDLTKRTDLSGNAILWVADTMSECDLPFAAASILRLIDETILDANEAALLAGIRGELRLASFAQKH